MTELKELDFSTLTFCKLRIPRLIPKHLIQDVKGRTFTEEQFYDYQEKNIDNPFNHLFALIDSMKKIHGFLWVEINLLDKSLFVNTFSVDKAYWGKGKAIEKVIKFLEELKKLRGAPAVFWMTTNPKFFEKKGFKRSKNVLMEYNSEKGDTWDNHAAAVTTK